MTYFKMAITALLLGVALNTSAQKAELLSSLPETEKEWKDTEANVLASVQWLEDTPLDQNPEKHKAVSAVLLLWIINSPSVTIELSDIAMQFTKKNPEMMVVFLAGWTKYSLKNNYSQDPMQGTVAGLQSIIKAYQAGGYKKDKKLVNLIAEQQAGGLEQWVKEHQ